MALTSEQVIHVGNYVRMIVESDLSGVVYFYWYLNRTYLGMTTTPEFSIHVDAGDGGIMSCVDTNSASFDPIANAPDLAESYLTAYWVRSLDVDVVRYEVIIRKIDGYEELHRIRVPHDPIAWDYCVRTPLLDQNEPLDVKVIGVDASGNVPVNPHPLWASVTIHGVPVAPRFEMAYNVGAADVTFSELL